MSKVTVTAALDYRSSKQDGSYPVKIRIFHNRDSKRYGTDIAVTREKWAKLDLSKPKGKTGKEQQEIEIIRQKIASFRNKAQQITDALKEFSFEAFEKEWFNKLRKAEDAYILFDTYVTQLKTEKRINTAHSYRDTLHSLQKFKKSLKVEQITVDFLKKYESWMLARGKSLTTIGIYARNIRTIVNQAIAQGSLLTDAYPFHSRRGGYSIPQGSNIKRALSEIDLKKLLDHQADDPYSAQARAVDFFVLSYLSNGANFKDICRWKYKNIVGNQLIFLRAKTERTTRQKPIQIKVFLSERIKQIINKWGNTPAWQDSYIFQVFSKTLNAEQERACISQFIKTTNKYLKRIARQLEIEADLTTYTARHTFATRLKRKGASTEFIKESLGHQNIATTENYLDSFEDAERMKWATTLLE